MTGRFTTLLQVMRRAFYSSLVSILLLDVSCGGGGSSASSGNGGTPPPPPPPPTITSVTVSGPVDTQAGACVTFTAVVSGTGNFDHTVTWYVNGVAGGDSTDGLIYNGDYCAPSNPPPTNPVTIMAVANGDKTKSGSVMTRVLALQVSPSQAQVYLNGTQQFTATEGIQVNWRATYGYVDSSGLYTATRTETPDTVTAWNSYGSASATVQILAPAPVITSISPQPATAGDQLTITGQNLDTILTTEFPDAIGGTIPVQSYSANGTSATITVPQGSVTGSFYVKVQQGGLAPVQSNTVQFQRLARLRVRSPQNDLGAGESVDFQYALLGDSTPRTVTFTADQGTFSGSTYFAPASVASDSFVHVQACITGTQSCDSLILGLHPFRITPAVPLVPLGQTLQLSEVGASGSIDWSLLAGGGSLQQSGLYTAGSTLPSGGPALIAASSSGVKEQTSVGVTGGFPGLLNRIYDYVDQHTQSLLGTYTLGLAVSGNRLYVPATNHQGGWTDSYYWIDVYDITDPPHPAWITAVESNSAGPLFAVGNYLYSYTNCDFGTCSNTITLYSIQSGIPVLRARAGVPQWWNIADNHGVLTLIPMDGPYGQVIEYDLTSGTIVSTTLNLTLPPDANQFIPDTSLAVGKRMFLSVETNDLNRGGYIVTYDLSASPPTMLGTTSARSLAFYTSGSLLFGALGGMEIYDISGQLPVEEGYVDGINAKELVGTELLARTGQQGCQIVDISNPPQPSVTSILFDGVIAGGCDGGTFIGNYVYAEEGDGGIVIYDASKAGGPIPQAVVYGGPHLSAVSYDLLLQSNTLYSATATFDGPALEIYDTSTIPAKRLGEYIDLYDEAGGFAVQASGHYVYFGKSDGIDVIDVSQPSSPTLAGTVASPAISLARVNNTLYAGTSNNTLLVLDITNPAQPSIVRTIALADLPIRMRVYGNLLLVADNAAGLLIYDISNPRSPVHLSTVQSFTVTADVAVQGTTAYVAADIDGLGILDISNPAQPVLISKTGLARIDPFYNEDPANEALTVTLNNGLVYVGTLYDNGLVFGLDCSNLAVPRIVSVYAYAFYILGWSGALVFNGTQLFVAGDLNGGVYPVTEADMSQPYDSMNQYFPPPALQSPLPPGASARVGPKARYRLNRQQQMKTADRFHRIN